MSPVSWMPSLREMVPGWPINTSIFSISTPMSRAETDLARTNTRCPVSGSCSQRSMESSASRLMVAWSTVRKSSTMTSTLWARLWARTVTSFSASLARKSSRRLSQSSAFALRLTTDGFASNWSDRARSEMSLWI